MHENCTIVRVLLDTPDTHGILFNKITYLNFMLTFVIIRLITRGNSLGPGPSSFLSGVPGAEEAEQRKYISLIFPKSKPPCSPQWGTVKVKPLGITVHASI